MELQYGYVINRYICICVYMMLSQNGGTATSVDRDNLLSNRDNYLAVHSL